MDRVQPIKIESPGLGGTEEDVEYTPIEPQEDAIEVVGVYLQDASNRDESTLISRSGDDMLFKDGNNAGGKTLTQLAAAGAAAAKNITVSFASDHATGSGPGSSSLSHLGLVSVSTDYELKGGIIWPGSAYIGTPDAISASGIHSNASGTGYVKIYDLTNAAQIAEGTFTGTSWGVHDLGTLSNISSGEAIWEVHLKVSEISGPDNEIIVGSLQVTF